ncbi:helix-turn-helix domain-containing protein [Streptosporangium sp. NPDC049078]|uniref:helix-turn-helix domain-containing protein n=1 Tax=Streptosporangium sp. NPDC049078 TaxID=3155767 RepID=UPI0034481461
MDTTAAATQASVTVATIRTWCRKGVIAALKVSGRWVIEAASLARRIALGAKTVTITPISRDEFEAAVANLGIRHPFMDARCLGEYRAFKATGEYYIDGEYDRLMVARGKALAQEGWTPPQPRPQQGHRGDFAHREMSALTGLSSRASRDECHYCGLDPRTCDCI